MKKIIGYGLIILVALGIVILNIPTSYSYFEDNGYAIPDAKISHILSARDISDNKDIKLISTKENEEYKEQLGSYYNEKDEALDLNFPLIIKDGTALRFLTSGAYLINDSFEYSQLIEKAIVSDQTYFSDDGNVLDTGNYMMVQLSNKLFISTTDMKIQTSLRTYELNKFSIFYFSEEYVNVYQYVDGKYEFVAIRGLTNAKISINDKTLSYSEFYKELLNVQDIIAKDIDNQENITEEVKKHIKNNKEEITSVGKPTPPAPSDTPSDAQTAPETPSDESTDAPEDPPEDPGEIEYIKPTVKVSDISAWVYTINGQLEINDPASRISGGIVFYVYDADGNLVLRQSVKKAGLLNLSILEPDSYYYVTAKFDYLNRRGNNASETVLEATYVKTLPIDGNIEAVTFGMNVDSISLPHSMKMNDINLKNSSDYDNSLNTLENFYKNTLPYIYRITYSFKDSKGDTIDTNLSNAVLSCIKKGETMSYETSKILESKTKYNYVVTCYDKFGNELTITPKVSGEYETSKEEPKVKANLLSSDQSSVILKISLEDIDNTLTSSDYTMRVYNGNQLLTVDYSYLSYSDTADKISINKDDRAINIELKALPYATKLRAVFTGDYNLENGQGEQKNKEIGVLDFYSGSLPNGSIFYEDTFKDIGGTFASMDLSIQRSSTSDLVALLTDMTFTIDSTHQKIEQKISQNQFDSIDIDKNYNDKKGYLLIQNGSVENEIPEILLYATKDTLKKQGIWQTFLNSGILGDNNALSGKLRVNYLPGTLTTTTKYNYSMSSNTYINNSDHAITTNITSDHFNTLANDVLIGFDDFFLAENFIELYDISSIDTDNVIIGGTFYLQLLEDNEIIDSEPLKVGETKDTIRFGNLKVGHQYTLRFMAPEYNQGTDESTLEKQHIIDEYPFLVEEGVSASIHLDNVHYSYQDDTAETTYVSSMGNGITEKHTYNVSTKQLETDDNSFITDYIPFESGKISVFQDFGTPEKIFRIIAYRADKSYYTYTSPSRANFYTFDQYCNSGWLTNTNIKYIRIVGYTGYEKNARFYQIDSLNLEALTDVKENADVFIDGVSPGTNGFDTANMAISSTDYISVSPGETILFNSNRTRYVYFYDEDHKYITTRGGGAYDYGGCEVPAQAAYVRYAITNLDKDNDVALLYRVKNSQVQDYIGRLNWTVHDSASDGFVMSEILEDNHYYLKKSISDSIDKLSYSEKYTHKTVMDYEEDGSLNINDAADETLEAKKAFKYELIVKYHNRELVLATYEFNTENKIYLLRNSNDLKLISYDTYATFIAVNDIVEDASYAPVNPTFGGKIDFQGHSLTLNYKSENFFIYYLTPKGVIQNINVIYNSSIDRGFVANNFGKIKDFVYTVEMDTDELVLQSMVNTNQQNGEITNFAIKLVGDVIVYHPKNSRSSAILCRSNYGTISDGYIYNTQKDAHVYVLTAPKSTNSSNGILTAATSNQSVIKNIYSTVDIYCDYNTTALASSTGIISGGNSGRVSNVFGVGLRYYVTYDAENNVITNKGESSLDDPLIGFRSGVMTSTNGETETGLEYRYSHVYFHNTNGTSYDPRYTYSKEFNLANLYDSNWYSAHIQSDNQFDVENYINQGFYPLVKTTQGNLVSNQTLNALPELSVFEAPTVLDSVIDKSTDSYVDVVIKFNNTSSSTITAMTFEGVSGTILEQSEQNGVYQVKVRLSAPTMYVTGYKLTSYSYRNSTNFATVNCELNVNATFYKSIDSLDEWADWLGASGKNKHLNYNYRLTNNLDFSSVTDPTTYFNKYFVSGTFTGILDGGRYDLNGELTERYVIQEIHLGESNNTRNSILFDYVKFGTIKNLDFRSIEWNKPTNSLYVALFLHADYSTFDHVNIRDINLSARSYTGTLLAYGNNSTISNCTVNDATLGNNFYANATYIGGLVAQPSNFLITNCYVGNVDIKTERVDLSYSVGIGGIIGYGNGSTKVMNSYATGQIKSTSYVGGIGGNGNYFVDKCYSDVYIETDGDYNGGIAGTTNMDTVVQNSFSVGNFVYALSNPTYTNRIISVESYWWLNNNYAYKNQTFNNQVVDEKDATGVLSYTELMTQKTYTDKIKFDGSYDYSQLKDGTLPKLKATTGELLPYQEDRFLTSGELSAEIISTHYDGAMYYNTDVRIKHEGYEVDQVMIEGMQIMDGYPQKGETGIPSVSYYTIKSTNTAAYDIYRVRITVHSIADPTQTKVMTLSADYNAPVYWTIHNIDEWQEVMAQHATTNENIKIAGTIDFSQVSNPIVGIVANRFEGDTLSGTENVLKNLRITDNLNTSLISVIYTEISNLGFENIGLEFESLNKSAGVINIVQGTGSQLSFNNCYITNASKGQIPVSSNIYLGMIANAGGELKDCKINGITIKAKSNNTSYRNIISGGLVGYATNSVVNVEAKNVNIDVDHGNYVGGIIGYAYKTNSGVMYINNIRLVSDSDSSRSKIKGSEFIGGLIGRSVSLTIYGSYIKNADILSYYNSNDNIYNDGRYVGGLVGYTDTLVANDDFTGYNAENITVEGDNAVGGLMGRSVNTSGLTVKKVEVMGDCNVGGQVGYADGTLQLSTVEDTKVTARKVAGGLVGYTYSINNSYVLNSTVKANYYAGGLTGLFGGMSRSTEEFSRRNSWSNDNGVVGTTIEATNGYAGGIVGYVYLNTSSGVYRNFVKSSIITAGSTGFAGGLIGEADSGCFYQSYVDDHTTVKSSGNYVGGIAGKLTWVENDYNSRLYRTYSQAQVNGSDYVGGIFGQLDNQVTDSAHAPYLFSNINLSTITATGQHVYGIGHVTDGSLASINSGYYGSLVSYDQATINGSKITKAQLTNVSDEKWSLVTAKDLTNYTKLSSSLASGGLSLDVTYFNHMITTAVELENYAVSYKGIQGTYNTASARYSFDLSGINLHNGHYGLRVKTTGNTNLGEQEITIADGKVKDVLVDYGNCTTQLSFVFTIYDLDTSTDYCQSTIYNIHPVYTTKALSVNNVKTNYIYEENPHKAITLNIDDPSDLTWRWYRIYKGSGYSRYTVDVTNLAQGSSLTTNVAGVYYAQSTTGNYRTQLFTYDTYVYSPLLSKSTLSNLPYQNGYSGGVSSYAEDMNYKDAISFTMATKMASINDQEDVIITLPTANVYASGASTVNVEFDESIPWETSNPLFEITIQVGSEIQKYDVKGRVMTFGYDYSDDLQITITSKQQPDKVQSSTYLVDTLTQSLSLYGDNYYYLMKNGVKINDNTIDGEFIHIYHNQGIKKIAEGHVLWDLDSNTKSATIIKNAQLFDNPVPLSTKEVSVGNVQYYKSFMYNATTKLTSTVLLFKTDNGEVGFDGSTNRVGNGLIIDYMSVDVVEGGENVTELTPVTSYLQNSALQNVKALKLPSDFNNNNIIELANNYDSNQKYAMVKYGYSDKVIVFNYTTGEMISNYSSDTTSGFSLASLLSYGKTYLNNFMSFLSDSSEINSEILTVNELEDELLKIPDSDFRNINQIIDTVDSKKTNSSDNKNQTDELQKDDLVDEKQEEENINQTTDSDNDQIEEIISRDYVPVYNENTQTYDIYTTQSILHSQVEKPKSENEKVIEAVNKGYQLSISSSIITQKDKIVKSQNIRVFGFMGLFSAIIVLWFVLRNKLKKND